MKVLILSFRQSTSSSLCYRLQLAKIPGNHHRACLHVSVNKMAARTHANKTVLSEKGNRSAAPLYCNQNLIPRTYLLAQYITLASTDNAAGLWLFITFTARFPPRPSLRTRQTDATLLSGNSNIVWEAASIFEET